MSHIILIHGSFHDGRCWSKIIPLLEAAGHEMCAVTFTGQNGGRRKSPFRITAHDYSQDILSAVQKRNEPAIAIAHSMGGFPMSMAAEERPDLFRHLIYLSALVPANQRTSALAVGQGDNHSDFSKSLKLSLHKGTVEINPETAKRLFYTDCTPADQQLAMAQLQPQPIRPLLTKYKFTASQLGSVSKSYITCTEDQALSLEYQRDLQRNQQFEMVETLSSSHSPFIFQPEKLVRLIESLIARM